MRPATKFLCASTPAVTTLTASFNTVGFNYCQIVAFGNATTGLSGTNTILEESDDDSSFSSVPLGITIATTSAAVSVAKVVMNVDLRGRKKFLKPTISVGATQNLNFLAILHNGGDAPATASEINSTFVSNI